MLADGLGNLLFEILLGGFLTEVFPAREIVVSLIRQLSWTHFIALIPLSKPLQRASCQIIYRIMPECPSEKARPCRFQKCSGRLLEMGMTALKASAYQFVFFATFKIH